MRQIGGVCDTLKSILGTNLCTLHNIHVLYIIHCDTLKSILEANLCTLHNIHVLYIIHCDTLKSILDADHDKVDMLVHCAQLATGSPFENYFASSCKSQIEDKYI